MPIRVLIADLSPVIECIVRDAMEVQADMELVGSYPDHASALSALATRAADVLIVRAGALGAAAEYRATVGIEPGVKLVGMVGEAEAFFELRLLVVDPGLEAFLEAIRSVARVRMQGASTGRKP